MLLCQAALVQYIRRQHDVMRHAALKQISRYLVQWYKVKVLCQ